MKILYLCKEIEGIVIVSVEQTNQNIIYEN